MHASAPSAPAGSPQRAPRWLAWTIAAGLGLYAALFLATVAGSFIRAPFGDGFDLLTVEFEAQDRGDRGLYLWHPHNGHHLVWLRLLTAIDVRVFHGTSLIFAATALAALLVTTALLSREAWRGADDRRLAWTLAAVSPLALLTSVNAFDVGVPINIHYVLALVFAVSALIVVEHARGGLGGLLAIVALVCAAAMGDAGGLAAIPVLVVAVFRRPQGGRLALFWIAGPIVLAAFLLSAGHVSVETVVPDQSLAARALRILRYFLGFCGLPWSASSQRVGAPGGLQTLAQAGGAAIGFLLVVVGLALAARPATGRTPRGRLDRLCCSLILFSLTAAAMAAVGRAYASPAMQIPVRYSVLMAPLHIGVLTLLAIRWPLVARLGNARLAAVLACAVVLALGQQVVGRWLVLGYCARIREAVAAFDAGRRTPDMTQYIYPELSHAEAITAEMKRRGLYQ